MPEKLLTFEEAHGKMPEGDELDRLVEQFGTGILDQWELCCCKCEKCAPTCRCGIEP